MRRPNPCRPFGQRCSNSSRQNGGILAAPTRSAWRQKPAIDRARRTGADLVGAEPEMVMFTGSATEANNTAIWSSLRAAPDKRRIVTAATEHSAVITMSRAQETAGYELVLVAPRPSGVVDARSVAEKINNDTALVSIMWSAVADEDFRPPGHTRHRLGPHGDLERARLERETDRGFGIEPAVASSRGSTPVRPIRPSSNRAIGGSHAG